jgi:hypothetical protein
MTPLLDGGQLIVQTVSLSQTNIPHISFGLGLRIFGAKPIHLLSFIFFNIEIGD